MKRLPGWRARLEASIDDMMRRPFDWARQHDCFDFCATAVAAITGEDIAARYRGCYKTEQGALRCMKRDGHANLADLIAAILPEIHPSQARIGDIAAFPVNDSAFGFSLGVVNGERVLVLRPEGVGSMGLLEASRAFRVGA